MPRRLPLLDSEGQLSGFRFIQFIEIYPYFTKKEHLIVDRIKESIRSRYKGDHDCYECFNPNYVLSHINYDKRKIVAYSSRTAIVDQKEDTILQEYIFLPKKFEN